MSKAKWVAQNEFVDPDTLCYVNGEEAFEHERTALAEMGAPDTEFLIFLDVVPEDRDIAIAEAECTPAFINWLIEQELLETE